MGKIEKDWITEAELRGVVLITDGTRSSRCGYVEVPLGHPLHGVSYSDQIPAITSEMVEGTRVGKKSPILAVTANVDADDDDSIRRSPDILLDCHGGLTYSGAGADKYPVESKGWWFGFDCLHSGDAPIGPLEDGAELFYGGGITRSLGYVTLECERLARQIVTLFGKE